MNIHMMVKKRQRLLWMSMTSTVLALFGCQDKPVQSGGSMDETSTLAFYKHDGRPAAGARVLVYASNDTTAVPMTQVFTGSDGSVELPSLPNGYYNLVVKDGAGFAAFQDSLVSDGSSLPFHSDTLFRMGALKGRVIVQPQNDPRSVWLAILGAGVYLNLDDSGRFEIQGMPEGRFTVALVTGLSEYTRTFLRAKVHRDSMTDLGDIRMVYTGLPVATDVQGQWDSLRGIVEVAWNPSNTNKVLGWKVMRKLGDSPDAPSIKVADLGPTARSWVDTVFNPDRIETGALSLRYWVQAIGSGSIPGDFHGSWGVDVRPPYLVDVSQTSWSLEGAAVTCVGREKNGCPTDTLQGALAYLATEPGEIGGSDRVELRATSNGKSWTTIWSASGPVIPGLENDAFFRSEARLWNPGEGIFHRSRFLWIEGRYSGRTDSIFGWRGEEGTYLALPLADSFVLHSIGLDGVDAPIGLPATVGANHAHLFGQGDSIAIIQVFRFYSNFLAGDDFRVVSRQILTPAGLVMDSPIAAHWIPDEVVLKYHRVERAFDGPTRIDGFGRGLFVRTCGRYEDGATVACSLSTAGPSEYTPLPKLADGIVSADSSLYFFGADWMSRADREDPFHWHAVEIPKVSKIDKSIAWNGRMWLFTTTGIWSSPQP